MKKDLLLIVVLTLLAVTYCQR